MHVGIWKVVKMIAVIVISIIIVIVSIIIGKEQKDLTIIVRHGGALWNMF